MISGLSHVAFSCNNIELASIRLEMFGYKTRFDEPFLKNDTSKFPFLSQFNPEHHVRAMSADGGMTIELLNHGGLYGPQSAAVIPVFRSLVPCEEWEPISIERLPVTKQGIEDMYKILGNELNAFFDPALSMIVLWIRANSDMPGLYACILPTGSLDRLKLLLKELRFRSDTAGMWSLLTPLPSLQARLIPVPLEPSAEWSSKVLLDTPGCSCLAMMTRCTNKLQLPHDLQDENIAFNLSVNKKHTSIIMARLEYGPIIELVNQRQ